MTHNHVARGKAASARAETLAHDVLDEAQSRITSLREEAKVRGQALLEKFKDRGEELLEEAQGRGRRALESSKDWVSENPAQAVGIAFVAGVIAHAWFSRDDD